MSLPPVPRIRGLFSEYTAPSSSTGEAVGVWLDFSRLPFCECGADFVSWVQGRYPALLETRSTQQLEQALVSIIKERDFRSRFVPPGSHPLNTCVQEVYLELVELINNWRADLERHPPRPGTGAHLFIGEKP